MSDTSSPVVCTCDSQSGTATWLAGSGSSPDRYELVETIGRGAMGVVYRATDRVTGREVAFKILHRRFLPNSVERKRFLREAQALAAVAHPNVVRVFDMGFDAVGHPFLVMELLPGDTLAEVVAGGPVDVELAIRITVRLLSALAAVHRAGIVHRDIKPGNIMVARVGGELYVKLVDFGLSRRFGESERVTVSGIAVGTPPYMSPEQVMGETVGPGSDVYAVGCTLFELLTGKAAFPMRDSKSVAALFRRILTEPAPLVSEYRDDVPLAVDRIVSVALQRDRTLRYPDCDAMRYALLEATGERSSQVPGLDDASSLRPLHAERDVV